jgi:hypothetical protein
VPFYTGPDGPLNEIIIGSSSFVTPVRQESARAGSVAYLLSSAIEQINTGFYKAEVTTMNVGARPLSADTYPVIGRTSIPNLIVCTGTKRDGFHLSPLLSEVLYDLIHDKEIDPRFEFFKPERKLIRELSREKAIEMAVTHQMNANYQHGFVPSHDRLTERIEDAYRADAEALHDKLGAYDWGIPPELTDMYKYGHIMAERFYKGQV